MFNVRFFNVACLAAVVLPIVGFTAAVAVAVQQGRVGTLELSVCAVMFVLTFVGVEVGYHRHFAHRAFCAHPAVRHVLGALGSMACQGTVIWWAGVHRTHHRFSDRDGDPHSPLEGLAQAHVGWLLRNNVNPDGWTRRVKELIRDPVVGTVHRRYPLYVTAGIVTPAVLVGIAEGSWQGLLSGLLWGGLVRMFLVNHIVWSINSICHTYGRKVYSTHDLSRNNYWLMLPSLGFSLHNNHHAFPKSATTSHVWWQIDFCGLVIRLMSACGLAWNVSIPSTEQLVRRRTSHPSQAARRRAVSASGTATRTPNDLLDEKAGIEAVALNCQPFREKF